MNNNKVGSKGIVTKLKDSLKDLKITKGEQWQYTLLSGLVLLIMGWFNYKLGTMGINPIILTTIACYCLYHKISKQLKQTDIIALQNGEEPVGWCSDNVRVIFIYRVYIILFIMELLVIGINMLLFGVVPDMQEGIGSVVVTSGLILTLVLIATVVLKKIQRYTGSTEDKE